MCYIKFTSELKKNITAIMLVFILLLKGCIAHHLDNVLAQNTIFYQFEMLILFLLWMDVRTIKIINYVLKIAMIVMWICFVLCFVFLATFSLIPSLRIFFKLLSIAQELFCRSILCLLLEGEWNRRLYIISLVTLCYSAIMYYFWLLLIII